mmetsp:Transcript_68187/g.120353  ORF Transcript_68187/g.120353 Transcript_68187/m.120353 type:complete len:373 (-) Transcript_68187:324-1442(-)
MFCMMKAMVLIAFSAFKCAESAIECIKSAVECDADNASLHFLQTAAAAPSSKKAARFPAALTAAGSEGTENKPQKDIGFVYLAQGPGQPPTWFVELSRRLDVMTMYLSYNDPTVVKHKGITRGVHVPNTTWTTGRNFLWQESQRLQESLGGTFQYFIFVDDDASVSWLRGSQRMRWHDDIEGWHRVYDKIHGFLLEKQPAVAALPVKTRWIDDWCPNLKGSGYVANVSELVPLDQPICGASMDAIWNAFHPTAATVLLPYFDDFDTQSWWTSQQLMILLLEQTFEAYSTTIPWAMATTNSSNGHSEYPRGELDYPELLKFLNRTVSPPLRYTLQDRGTKTTQGTCELDCWASRPSNITYNYTQMLSSRAPRP